MLAPGDKKTQPLIEVGACVYSPEGGAPPAPLIVLPHRRATPSPPVIPVCGLAHLTRDIPMVSMYETSPMVRIHPRSRLRRT